MPGSDQSLAPGDQYLTDAADFLIEKQKLLINRLVGQVSALQSRGGKDAKKWQALSAS